MANILLKRAITVDDMEKIYDFFLKQNELLPELSISAYEISKKFKEYSTREIRSIISEINDSETYFYPILGNEKGYILVTENKIKWGKSIIDSRAKKCKSQLHHDGIILQKIKCIEDARYI